jgi:predicted RNase H-like nuclease (RuvC/YqgF family)
VRSNSTSLSTYVIPFITEEKVPKAVEIISTASSNTIKKPLIKGSFNGEQVDNVIVDAIELQIDQQIIKNQTLEKSSLETVLTEKIEVLNLSNQASEEIRPVIKNPTHQIEKDKLLIKYQTLDILELRREIAEEKKKIESLNKEKETIEEMLNANNTCHQRENTALQNKLDNCETKNNLTMDEFKEVKKDLEMCRTEKGNVATSIVCFLNKIAMATAAVMPKFFDYFNF